MKTILSLVALAGLTHGAVFGADTDSAATAVNAFGLDLHRQLAAHEVNVCISPYSIQTAFIMAYSGAAGETKTEMAKVLHYSKPDPEMHNAFSALRMGLDEAKTKSAKAATESKRHGGPSQPISWNVANRLFGQNGFSFRPPFLALLQDRYGAPLEPLDFQKDAGGATRHINGWVEQQTKSRIHDLIPQGALNEATRLVLVNAIYLKAPWLSEFSESQTKPWPFHLPAGKTEDIPMMVHQDNFGYAKYDGYCAVSLAYSGGDLQFVVLVPDDPEGLPALEAKLTPELLAEYAQIPSKEVVLRIPKFKLEAPTLSLEAILQTLGMKTAFDEPKGSANFDGIAPRRRDGYLYLSKVFHKTMITVDEHGTEAAAATAATIAYAAGIDPAKPIEVNVARPFFIAIQHRPSGACLFVGRYSNPAGLTQSRRGAE